MRLMHSGSDAAKADDRWKFGRGKRASDDESVIKLPSNPSRKSREACLGATEWELQPWAPRTREFLKPDKR